jgi:hypothetical protein
MLLPYTTRYDHYQWKPETLSSCRLTWNPWNASGKCTLEKAKSLSDEAA